MTILLFALAFGLAAMRRSIRSFGDAQQASRSNGNASRDGCMSPKLVQGRLARRAHTHSG
jgi:hypothetical protein